ncbi:MAG: hypothetical protein ACSHWU_00955 [Marinicella sp.]
MNNYFIVACVILSGYFSTAFAGDLIFKNGFDDLNAFSGEYEVKTVHDFGSAYPRNPMTDGTPQSGDHVDALLDFFEFPVENIAAVTLSIPEVEGGLIDPEFAELMMSQVFDAAFFERFPDYIGNSAAVTVDFSELLNNPKLIGSIQLPTEPDINGIIPNSSHSYFALEIDWNFACILDPNEICDPLIKTLREVTGNPTLTVSSFVDTTVIDNNQLSLPAHSMNVPYGELFRGVIEQVMLPGLTQEETINSFDKFVNEVMIDMVIEYHNFENPTQEILCGPICLCEDTETAYESLLFNAGLNPTDAELIGQHACATGAQILSTYLYNSLDGLTVDPAGGVWQTLSPCQFGDDNSDLMADRLGPGCEWSQQIPLNNGDLLNTVSTFGSDD